MGQKRLLKQSEKKQCDNLKTLDRGKLMIQQITVRRSQNPRIAVRAGGRIICSHYFKLRQMQNEIWKIEDDNIKDTNLEDIDNRPQYDQHPIKNALNGITGRVMLSWAINMFSYSTDGEFYDVNVMFIQDDESTILGHYKHTDEGYGPLKDIRSVPGLTILNIED